MKKYEPHLKMQYLNKTIPLFMKQFSVNNCMQVPCLISIYLSMGVGNAANHFEIIDKNKKCLEKICGQQAIVTNARKSIASFKIRHGMPIGLKVTLRKTKMWEFLDRFINIALPRVKDFRGIFSNFDGNGNITIGIKEQVIFPEIDYRDIDKNRGLNITILTSSNIDNEAKFILTNIGLPLI